MRVLLTGHKGYLGTVMAPVLAAAGHEVVGLDSGLFEDCLLGPAPADPAGFQVDLRDVTVLKMPDGRLPSHWEEAKNSLEELRRRTDPDLILALRTDDAHQDHRGLAKLVPTVYRDHLALGYEIVKWDGDLGSPSVYQPLDDEVAEDKVRLLQEHYASQRHRPWYDREAFLGLARIRGIESSARYAEAFFVKKLQLDLKG